MPHFDSDYEAKLYADRVAKLDRIAEISAQLGLSRAEALYPNTFRFTHTLPELLALGAAKSAEELEAAPTAAAVAGRVMSHRLQGKTGFAHLQQSGERLQIYVRKDGVGASPEQSETLFALYKLLDLGDHIGVRGTLMRTRTGELTLKVHPLASADFATTPGPLANSTLAAQVGRPALEFLGKSMLALPDKYHGLEDVELRYRQRYVDLIMNSGTLAKAEVSTSVSPASVSPASVSPAPVSPAPGSPAPVSPASVSPASSSKPSAAVILSAAKDLGISPEAPPLSHASHKEGAAGFSPLNSAPPKEGASAPGLPPVPGTSPVTDTATPNAQHEDAPRNVREVFVKRAAVLRAVRKFFDARGYLEVETPMMHTVAGGAAARPFKTHHNALDIPLSLRIAPELFLKRLVVGGMDRVYEINRNFRNEGVSTQHNPEFTMLEFYQAYSNYHDLMDLTIELIAQVAQEVNGTTTTHFNGHEIDLSARGWTKLSMREAIIKFWPEGATPPRPADFGDRLQLAAIFHQCSIEMRRTRANGGDATNAIWIDDTTPSTPEGRRRSKDADMEVYFEGAAHVLETDESPTRMGNIIAEVFENLAEEHLTQPTIIYDFPLAVSPLSKVKPGEPDWVERFEFYIGGFEVGNAFSELNDAADQEARFAAQVADKDPESMSEVDHDYVRALGYGLPPTAGEGIGIDRLTMLLTGSRSIRDVILFPLLRPQTKPGEPKSEDDDHTHGESAE